MKKKTANKHINAIIEADDSKREVMTYSKTLEPLRIVVAEVLKGENCEMIKSTLKMKGFDCGRDKVYRMIKIAKKKIASTAEKDFLLNYKWVEENLFNIHAEAFAEKDQRLRLMVIDKLMTLWSLNVTRVESIEMQVTPEKLAEYEQILFG
jgi:hypothetical protein